MSSFSSIGTILNTIWALAFIAPLYIVLATVLCQTFIFVYHVAKRRTSYIYQYLGDITWAFPFSGSNPEFNLTQILLVAVILAILSTLVIGFMIQTTYGEDKYQKTKARILKEIKEQQEETIREETDEHHQAQRHKKQHK